MIAVSKLLWRKLESTHWWCKRIPGFLVHFALAVSRVIYDFPSWLFWLVALPVPLDWMFYLCVILLLQSDPKAALISGLLILFIWLLLPTHLALCTPTLSCLEYSVIHMNPFPTVESAHVCYVLTLPPPPTVGQLLVLIIPTVSECFRARKEPRIQSCFSYNIIPRI